MPRATVWPLLRRLLASIDAASASFAKPAAVQRCQAAFATLGRLVWLLHSDDGHAPPGDWSPLSGRPSPFAVLGRDLLAVWVDRPSTKELNRRVQRGALIGLPNAAPQQVLMLLLGAWLGVKVQVARNEGNMALRMSSCALKDSEDGKLSAKSTAPVYSDCDAETFGTLAAKEVQAKRQVKAWKANNDLIFDVATVFTEPRLSKYKGVKSPSNRSMRRWRHGRRSDASRRSRSRARRSLHVP